MTISDAYADLGGGTSTAPDTGVSSDTPVQSGHLPRTHRHRFDHASGWCGCGARDSGELAEGSIAWRAARATA